MPTYTIKAPNGQTYDVEAPTGATQEQIRAYVLSNFPNAGTAPAPAPRRGSGLGDAAMTLQRALPGVSELSALVGSRFNVGADLLAGRTRLDPADVGGSLDRAQSAAFDASRGRQTAMVDRFKAAHPNLSALATGTGYAVQAVPAMMTGGATLLPQIEANVSTQGTKALIARLARGAPKNAVVGGGYAAVNGLSQPGTLDQRIEKANADSIPGAVLGAGFPVGAELGIAGLRRAAPAMTDRVRAAAGRVLHPEAAPVPVPERLTNPQARAAQIIKNAIERDKVGGHVRDETKPLRFGGGENVAAAFDVVAQSPGPGRQIMKDAAKDHAVATSKGIREDIGAALGGKGDYFATRDAASKARSAKFKPVIEEAFETPIGADTFDKEIAPILARLPDGSALNSAKRLAKMAGKPVDERGSTMIDTFDGYDVKTNGVAPEKVSARDLASIQRGSKVGFGQGESLIKFLSKLGLKDENGELSKLDADLWHKGGPFRRKLIQEDGISIEDAAQRAHEAGYFPDHFAGSGAGESYHAVSPADLIASIQAELAGKPRFSRAPDPKAVDRLGRLDGLSERLRDANADVGSLDKVSAGQALADHQAELLRLEAHLYGEGPGMTPNVQADTFTPSLRTLDYIKRGIGETLEKYRNGVTGKLDLTSQEAAHISRIQSDLGKAMRRVNGKYDEAMGQYGDDSDHLDALKLGRDVFSGKFDMQAEQLRGLHQAMSVESKEQFQKGVGEAIIAQVRTKGSIAAVRKLLADSGDEFRDRVSLAFDDDPVAFGKFIESLQGRADDAARDARYQGGAATYGRAAARADFDGEQGAIADALGVVGDVLTMDVKGMSNKAMKAGLKIGRFSRNPLNDPAASAMMARAGNNPDDLTAMLNLLQMRRRIAAAPRLTAGAKLLGNEAAMQAGGGQRQ